jgi:hypothetical protein
MAALGIAALALLFTWIFGGFLLRAAGLLLVFTGAIVLALSGNANGILVAAIGAVLWLLGHGHYALRHHEYKSPLAGYVFLRWAPGWLDPTRGWGIPVVDSEAERRRP